MKVALYVLISLIAVSSFADDGVKAKTMNCQVNYAYAKDGQEVSADLPPVSVKTVRDIDAPRMNAKAEQKTVDGRFEVLMRALQPVKGDITKYEQVDIQITDNVSKTYIFPGDLGLTRAGADVDHAHFQIISSANDPNTDFSLTVNCDLK